MSTQDFADYLHRRCEYLTRTNSEVETKLADDSLQLLRQLDDGILSADDSRISQAFFHIDCVIGNTFRYTMLAGVCSFLEEAVKELSRRIVSGYRQKLKEADGNFLSRHITMLSEAGLETLPIQTSIDKFKALIRIRNSIIHAWGEISAENNPEQLRACIDMIETAEESADGRIYLGDQVVADAINCAEEIVEHVLKTMADATML